MQELKHKIIEEFENQNYPLGRLFKDKLMNASLITIQSKLRSMELMPPVTKFGGD